MLGNPLCWMQHDSCHQIVINEVFSINSTPISSPPLPPPMQYCAPPDQDDARVCTTRIPSLQWHGEACGHYHCESGQ